MRLSIYLSLIFLICSNLQAKERPTILFIGDSHSYGKLGLIIEKHLLTVSDHVIMESSCGATPKTWLGSNGYEKTVCGFWKKDGLSEVRSSEHVTPKLIDEVRNYKPQITIIQLGTNIAASSSPKNFKTSIETMMNLITDANSLCVWIGPPDANSNIVTRDKLLETNILIRNLAQANHCYYIDSLLLTKFPENNKEGIHYPPGLSAKWGESISEILLDYIRNSDL